MRARTAAKKAAMQKVVVEGVPVGQATPEAEAPVVDDAEIAEALAADRKRRPANGKTPPSIFVDRLAGWSEHRTDLDQTEYVRADLVHKLTEHLNRNPSLQRRQTDTMVDDDTPPPTTDRRGR